jgi:SAM-dependent methyltransferase
MENQLTIIANAYDKLIEFGRKGIDSHKDLPDCILNDPDYPEWKSEKEKGNHRGSENKDIKEYLMPEPDLKFIDLGCCLNLMFKGYNEWSSVYYGVDISKETIQLLDEYVIENKLSIGKLCCESMHKTSFENNFFDIGTCIGMLEYFEDDFLKKVINEIYRIMKPDGKFVINIPNINSPSCKIMYLMEEYLGRPCKFNILPNSFEKMLSNLFEIEKKDNSNNGFMELFYYLKCKK